MSSSGTDNWQEATETTEHRRLQASMWYKHARVCAQSSALLPRDAMCGSPFLTSHHGLAYPVIHTHHLSMPTTIHVV